MKFKELLQEWLDIGYLKRDRNNYVAKFEYEDRIKEIFRAGIKEYELRLRDIEKNLKIPNRARLEQAHSALKLLTSYLNEINDLEKESRVKNEQ